MSNKNVIAIFVVGLALLLGAFWAGLYVVRQDAPKPAAAPAASQAAPAQTIPAQPTSAQQQPAQDASQTSPDAKFVVQVYSFGTGEKANELVAQLRKQRFFSAYAQGPTADDPLYRVRIGPFNDRDQAQQAANQLAGQGFKGVMIIPWKPN